MDNDVIGLGLTLTGQATYMLQLNTLSYRLLGPESQSEDLKTHLVNFSSQISNC